MKISDYARLFEELITLTKIRDQDILDSCTDAQKRAWVQYALLGFGYEQIARRMSASDDQEYKLSNIQTLVASAQYNIINEILRGQPIAEFIDENPQLAGAIRRLQGEAANDYNRRRVRRLSTDENIGQGI
jgi:hypothetical protein